MGEIPKSTDWAASSIMKNNANSFSNPIDYTSTDLKEYPKNDSVNVMDTKSKPTKEYTGPGENIVHGLNSLNDDIDTFKKGKYTKHLFSAINDKNITVNPTKNSELTLGMGNFGPDKVRLPGVQLKVNF